MTVGAKRTPARALAWLVLALALGCGPRPYTPLSDSAEPLRTQFNQDVGRVRIVMLVAPT